LAVAALAGACPVSQLAQEYQVSRPFVYRQADKAQQALADAFHRPTADDMGRVLFDLPVTKAFLHQLVLGLVLLCHSSFRGAVELLRDLFDFLLVVRTVGNIVRAAVDRARRYYDQ
jgi:hypothetical protein